MATSTKIHLTPEHGGVFSVSGLSWASARKVSEVLQHDMENHHIYLNEIGFHNHIVHYMLTSWALGASPTTIQSQYSREAHRQRPALPRNEALIHSFHDKEAFMACMHREEHYPNYLAFFQRAIAEKGVPDVINEYLFSGDDLAQSLLSRIRRLLRRRLRRRREISEKLVEMITTAIYWTTTSQNTTKQLKLDFFYIHAVNLSIFFKAFMDLPYLTAASKARLLEMKGRMDLLIWASRKMPDPRPDDLINYPIHRGWPEVFARSYLHPTDDGHLAKFVRTVAFAEGLCRSHDERGENEAGRIIGDLPVRGDMWLQIGNIGVVFQDM
ncbi:hypothetical protein BJX66DRAFT_343075 [Aspergillus keveii]|uniref:HypA-like protein n=1 Tax=Aspergillus keveii TaxID=714993 RepID=A0ABR4FQ93_9EURO